MKDSKKFLTKILSAAMLLTLSTPFVVPVHAAESVPTSIDKTVVGGWDEETGYFNNTEDFAHKFTMNSELVPKLLRASTPKHTGKRERNDDESTTRFRAHGWTTWTGMYHYTRARMEEHFFGKVTALTDSGRQWGQNGTEAISPWWYFDPDVGDKARTYYGN